jgi:hypothetical protein
MSKFKLILALTFAGLAMAATPIKDLVLQSNMDAAGFNITNAGDISNGDEVISMDGGAVTINPANGSSAFDVRSTAGKAISLDSAGLLRLGTHGFISANTNDVVLHGRTDPSPLPATSSHRLAHSSSPVDPGIRVRCLGMPTKRLSTLTRTEPRYSWGKSFTSTYATTLEPPSQTVRWLHSLVRSEPVLD